jgi:uncharacterized protein (DUF2236 family)
VSRARPLWLRGGAALAGAQPDLFREPRGEPALVPSSSLSWQVFRNPVALFSGGVAAVLLELAEPRVRSGVWDHTSFKTDPLARMERTGLAAMVTVYAARSRAEQMIAGVRRMHERVRGTTPDDVAYRASDPDLLDWVHATASFGFVEGYSAYVRTLSRAERDQFYAEGVVAGQLYGATGAPRSVAELEACFEAMRPKLEASPIVFEFLAILGRAPILPRPLARLQSLLIRSGVEITPPWLRERLRLGPEYGLRAWEVRALRGLARLADAIPLPSTPYSQARRRVAAGEHSAPAVAQRGSA